MSTWAVTFAGVCPGCGLHVSATGSGVPDAMRPTADKLDDTCPYTCLICNTEQQIPCVGITRDPYVAAPPETPSELVDDDDEYDTW